MFKMRWTVDWDWEKVERKTYFEILCSKGLGWVK